MKMRSVPFSYFYAVLWARITARFGGSDAPRNSTKAATQPYWRMIITGAQTWRRVVEGA